MKGARAGVVVAKDVNVTFTLGSDRLLMRAEIRLSERMLSLAHLQRRYSGCGYVRCCLQRIWSLLLDMLSSTSSRQRPASEHSSICKRPYCGYKAAETMMRQKADGSGAVSHLARASTCTEATGKNGRRPVSHVVKRCVHWTHRSWLHYYCYKRCYDFMLFEAPDCLSAP